VLWDVLSSSGLFSLRGHSGPLTAVAFLPTPGRDLLASAGQDGGVKIWDLELQQSVQALVGHSGAVWCLAAAEVTDRSGTVRARLVTGCCDGRLRMWDVGGAGEAPARYMGSVARQTNEGCASVAFHPAGGKAVGCAARDGRAVEIYRVRSGEEGGKRRNRRVRRRREKEGKKAGTVVVEKGRKRGILDEEDEAEPDDEPQDGGEPVDFELVAAGDELCLAAVVRTSHKIKGFSFLPAGERGGGVRVALTLSSSAVEVHRVDRLGDDGALSACRRLHLCDMYGHPAPIRGVAVSPDDELAVTVGKGAMKVWSVEARAVLRSLPLAPPGAPAKAAPLYALCVAFVPGSLRAVVGTKEGCLMLVDCATGDVLSCRQDAHGGAVWSVDVTVTRNEGGEQEVAVVSGSADKSAKFWAVEPDEDSSNPAQDALVHTQTMEMKDDVVAVKFTYSQDAAKSLVCISSLDSTVKVFFADTLKFFLSLYGHKLPALALDASDDDALLCSGGADKTLKLWGLDFGDCHRSMHGHTDSVTAVKFVRKTHNFFSASKDKTVRYWDADKYEQILLLCGHVGEVSGRARKRAKGEWEWGGATASANPLPPRRSARSA
jgi:U3 small nucleolar RNA-associated protein 12